ncbi:MAG: phosphodiester glycosidase family protein [Clostridiales bacterium]|nr:phosphodiester glycosidase family protein [Clostridiales bacterium]
MKLPIRILLVFLCAALIIAMPFVLSSPDMLSEAVNELYDRDMEDDDEGDDDEIDFSSWLISSARAEEENVEEAEIELFSTEVNWELPVDRTPGPKPNAALFTDNSYEDETIRATLEVEKEEKVTWYIIRVQIASPTQLRTAIIPGKNPAKVSAMAAANNAVVAISGDYYANDAEKTTLEYRMGEPIPGRQRRNGKKDVLIIDDQGDFHLFQKSEGLFTKNSKGKWQFTYEGSVVNAFTFGPALVIDGKLIEVDTEYGYHPTGHEPRAAIGQTGKLSYILLIAQASDRDGKTGATHQELANKMYSLGCTQAFNLDGGGTAEAIFGDQQIIGQPGGERSQSDIIYFATAVPE